MVRPVAGSWPFVGRTGELARADAILASGAGVLLLGEAGIGKTALARRLAERAAGGRAAVIQVSPWLTGAFSAIPLTPRERQIAALAAEGHTDLAIAGRLHISTRTVQTHLAHVYAKLGINRRSDLASHLR
jgi:DNA-binding CsgD family transcriptional regulator